jgi:hypothetical protein
MPKAPPATQPVGDLPLEQILIEPQQQQQLAIGTGVLAGTLFLSLPASKFRESPVGAELPQCWSGPSIDRRAEWEQLNDVQFDRFLRVASFVGGPIKTIRVVRYSPALTPSQIRREVRKVWLGVFQHASSNNGWSEGNRWSIEASVEYEDGKRSSILMDGWIHVQVEDREGKYWFIRIQPAVE